MLLRFGSFGFRYVTVNHLQGDFFAPMHTKEAPHKREVAEKQILSLRFTPLCLNPAASYYQDHPACQGSEPLNAGSSEEGEERRFAQTLAAVAQSWLPPQSHLMRVI